jgi:alpha-glucuronidase
MEVEEITWAWLRVCYEDLQDWRYCARDRGRQCQRRFRVSSMGRNVCVVAEVNGSPLKMDFSVINQCEVKLTAREATTMTPWVFVSRQIAHSSHRSQLI